MTIISDLIIHRSNITVNNSRKFMAAKHTQTYNIGNCNHEQQNNQKMRRKPMSYSSTNTGCMCNLPTTKKLWEGTIKF